MFWDSDLDDDDGSSYDESDSHNFNGSRSGDSESAEDGSRRFENYAQGRELLAELASQRKTGEFLDMVVQVEGREFPCHRAVLASTPYFKAMLSSNLAESSSKVVQLHEIDSISFCKILDFLYTGEIRISEDDVQDILQTAHMLQFDKILQYCRKFIQDNLCPSNCLGVMRLADMYGLSDLKERARSTAASNFVDVTQDEEFLSLSTQELLDLVGDENLKVRNEDDIVTFVIKWFNHAPEYRQKAILKILQEIRLSCVRVSVLKKLASLPVIQQSEECLAKITTAMENHLLGTQVEGEEASSPRRGISDNLAIIVGGWKAVKKPHPRGDSPTTAQPSPLQGIICFDPDSQQYYHIATLPTPVSGYMSVASAAGHLYVTGGRVHPLVGQGPHTAPSRQALRYDFPSDTWLRLPDLPRDRAGHQSVVVDGKLFLVGGDAEATSLVTMDCYDPEDGAWVKIHVQPTIHTSSELTVTAFREKVAFIEVSESTDDDPLMGAHISETNTWASLWRRRSEQKLSVHTFDVNTKAWRYANADIPVDHLFPGADIVATAVDDTLHIRTGYTRYSLSDLYIFDAQEETINEGARDIQDIKENILRARTPRNYLNGTYMNGQKGIVDAIGNYDFRDRCIPGKQTPLPFALFGHSFLETHKSCVRWYCRDLTALEKEDEREGSY